MGIMNRGYLIIEIRKEAKDESTIRSVSKMYNL